MCWYLNVSIELASVVMVETQSFQHCSFLTCSVSPFLLPRSILDQEEQQAVWFWVNKCSLSVGMLSKQVNMGIELCMKRRGNLRDWNVRIGGHWMSWEDCFSLFDFFYAFTPPLPSALTILTKCCLLHGAGLKRERTSPNEFGRHFKQQTNTYFWIKKKKVCKVFLFLPRQKTNVASPPQSVLRYLALVFAGKRENNFLSSKKCLTEKQLNY